MKLEKTGKLYSFPVLLFNSTHNLLIIKISKMKKRITQWLKRNLGYSWLAGFFRLLHQVSLWGMNYGGGASVEDSGEAYALSLLKKKYQDNSLVVFDVGANKGNYADLVLKTFSHKSLQLHCFEPSARTYSFLQNKIKSTPNILLNLFGLSSKEQSLILHYDTIASGMASVYTRNLDHIGTQLTTEEVCQFKTLDQYCNQQEIEKIDLLKLDVEGHELEVLQGGLRILPNIQFIQFEFGGCNIDSRTYFKDFYLLLKDNFDIYVLLKDGLLPIKTYGEHLEIFTTTNYFCVNKGVGKL